MGGKGGKAIVARVRACLQGTETLSQNTEIVFVLWFIVIVIIIVVVMN
jgi:hypothetical protein